MTKLLQAALTVELAIAANGDLPKEVRLFRAGANRTHNGTFMLTENSVKSCMDRWREWGVDLAFDYAHAMAGAKYSANPQEAMKAAGWCSLEARPSASGTELWATNCSWTPAGALMLKNREARYCSPMFRHSESGEVEEILNVALTAFPATFGADPMMASRNPEAPDEKDPPMFALLTLLGLPKETSEAAAAVELQKRLNPEATVLSVTGAKSMPEAIGTITGWKESAAQNAALTAKIAEQAVLNRKNKVAAMLSAAAGKNVAPAEVAMLTEMGEASDAGCTQLESYLKVKPAILATPATTPTVPTTNPTNPGAPAVGQLTPEMAKVAAMLGNSQQALAENVAKHGTAIVFGSKTPDQK